MRVNNLRHCHYDTRRYHDSRRGVTVLEVLFAIFVVIVGLLGIASIIPLAARNADQSNSFNNAVMLSNVWFNSFASRGLNDPDAFTMNSSGYNWQWYNDAPPGGFINFQKSYVGAPITIPGTNTSNTYSSTVLTDNIVRIWGHQAVCIDPLFMTDRNVVQRINNGTSRVGAYRPAVFPYFEDRHNPTEDPFNVINPWDDQPRMMRVTLANTSRLPAKVMDEIFASTDDLSTQINSDDKSIPATMNFSNGGKSMVTGEYSWFATLTPEEILPGDFVPATAGAGATAMMTERDYIVSIVVTHRRDRQFLAPGVTPTPGVPADKPGGERLTWVYPLSGNFERGSGGRVRIICSAGSDDTLHIGDWIMLGKHYLIDPTNTDHRYAFFRWYRIVAVDQERRQGQLQVLVPGGTDPYGQGGGNVVWARDVVLEGPDWTFFSSTGGPPSETITIGGTTYPVPTTGTLVSNVITVMERNINVD